MKLVIDIGNSRVRAGIFDHKGLSWTGQWPETDLSELNSILGGEASVIWAIVSSVRRKESELQDFLKQRGIRTMMLDHDTPLPIVNHYKSKTTLGYDRIAAAVGARQQFPGQNLLVIDAGTAITIDFLNAEGGFMGGNISPGLLTRFRSLYEFTEQLPMVEKGETKTRMGTDTVSAIRSGVQEGILFELDGYINTYKQRYSDLKVIMTGGDASFFANKLKNAIFVDLNLNLTGLLSILDYNVEE